MKGHTLPRALVEELLRALDPEGCARRRAKRLKRRSYSSVEVANCFGSKSADQTTTLYRLDICISNVYKL